MNLRVVRSFRQLVRAAAVLALLFGPVASALGRAGGGHSFSGGHSGGFGGGHSGGGGGFGGGYHSGGGVWIGGGPLTDGHQLITFLILAAVVIFVVVIVHYLQQAQQADVIRRGHEAVDESHHQQTVAQICAGDPHFDEGAFGERVKTAFLKIQTGWSAQNLEPARPFMSDGVWERFSLQISEQHERGFRNQVDNINIAKILIVQFVARGPHDALVVRIDATAEDYDVSIRDGTRLPGARRASSFSEYWTFARRRGAQTLQDKPGLIEGCCPNCGASLAVNQSAKCPSCGSLIRSGEYDWVLAEITQACEWSYQTEANLPGVEAFSSADPEFSAVAVEDRASVIFWRRAMADRLGDATPLAKVATAELCAAFTSPAPSGERTYNGDCAVGSVSLKGVAPGRPFDQAVVEIVWSGAHYKILAPGQPGKPLDEASVHQTLFILGRQPGVQSDPARGLSSSHCPSCGAPESKSAASACEFCGAVLNDGGHDWILLAVQRGGDGAAAAVLASFGATSDVAAPVPAQPRGVDLLAWAASVSVSDGELDDNERRMLEETARAQGVPPATLTKLLQSAQAGTLNLSLPTDPQEGQTWLALLANLALADGKVTDSENALLCRLGQALHLSPYDIRQYLIMRKTQLYQAAQAKLNTPEPGGPTTAA
ncbi:MAG TPA: TIM44-like domain-containing protein [Pirellulales bacterium]|nr:TIM44-like domain-containing protein [Pirellulales bacterium]